MDTLLFDPEKWGQLLVDVNGNIAVAGEPYRTAQDTSTSVKLFKKDNWYDTDNGIPYHKNVYALKADIPAFKSLVDDQALLVSGVDTVETIITEFKDRGFSGQIIVNNEIGVNL